MAPARRKGASKAAAAAAARRQWKVGDLVLAKVKGFPAWPATVSEPEKWGYSADWKKVLVYFFGTQQIAFCNPADVEAFTEEKKQSLLVKRQGKGADFVRAVQEIIDSYEKLKEQNQVDDINSGGDVTGENCRNSIDSSANVSKDQAESLEAVPDAINKNESIRMAEDAADAAQSDAFPKREASNGEPAGTVPSTETSQTVTYSSRKRSGQSRSHAISSQKNATFRGSRSSSRIQNLVMPSADDKSAGNVLTSMSRDASIRRSKRIRKSPDAAGWDDTDSAPFVSNGSIEDNGSEIATVDSDAFCPNDGNVIDSKFKFEHSDMVECLEGDAELKGEPPTLQIKAVVIKKKRKPNRKRVINDAAKPAIVLEQESGLEVGAQNNSQSSQNSCENLKESCSREDGDEHLPLLKRARVRMGKSSSSDTDLNNSSNTEDRNLKIDIINLSHQGITSSNCDNGSPADGDSSVLNGAPDNISPSKGITPTTDSGSLLCKIKKDQTCNFFVDGEAALPPSKRLHRALEAMSANAAEEDKACTEASSATKTFISSSCISSTREGSCIAIETTVENSLGLQKVDSCVNSVSHLDLAGFSKQPIENTEFQNDDVSESVLPGVGDHVGGEDSGSLSTHCVGIDTQNQLSEHASQNQGVRVESSQYPLGLSLRDDEGNHKIGEIPVKTSYEKEGIGISQGPLSGIDGTGKLSLKNILDVSRINEEKAICENDEFSKLPAEDNEDNDMCEVVDDAKQHQMEGDSNYISFPTDHLRAKGILDMHSSPSLTNGGECLAHGSPPNTSLCNTSTSESNNTLQNNGSCSPEVHLQQKKTLVSPVVDGVKFDSAATQRPKSSCRSAEAGHAALLSFEAMLGTLTRTKESIGRATRVAIDCAKFGIAAKVMEVLVRNLETESSLHRRVDLFFLVDSIAQCSRGLKGDVAGVYPSAIHAVLSRLLSAAAPPGITAQENRRQCLKVLRLWLERRILPESIIRQHMRELDSLSGSVSAGAFSRRSLRTERSLDDPVREMEGMLVDEYGSNSSFQLPGFCMPRMIKDEGDGSDSDGESFEAVTPEHNSEAHEITSVVEKRKHILEDVDGELEMEDVAPSYEVEISASCNVDAHNAFHFEKNLLPPLALPLPHDEPPSSPPLPSSPPPLPPLPPPPPPPPSVGPLSSVSDPYASAVDTNHFTDLKRMQDNPVHSVVQHMVAPRNNQSGSDGVHYHGPECSRDLKMQIPESSSSFSSFPIPPRDQNSEGVGIHHKGYPMRPPYHTPSNQFSFVHGNHRQHMKHRREAPSHSYSNRYHIVQNLEGENFYNNHERIKPSSYEFRDDWRTSVPFSGPRYQDKGLPGPYGCHPCEPARSPGYGWRFPPRSGNHRSSMPFRPSFEGPIPVAGRGPSYWRPR